MMLPIMNETNKTKKSTIGQEVQCKMSERVEVGIVFRVTKNMGQTVDSIGIIHLTHHHTTPNICSRKPLNQRDESGERGSVSRWTVAVQSTHQDTDDATVHEKSTLSIRTGIDGVAQYPHRIREDVRRQPAKDANEWPRKTTDENRGVNRVGITTEITENPECTFLEYR